MWAISQTYHRTSRSIGLLRILRIRNTQPCFMLPGTFGTFRLPQPLPVLMNPRPYCLSEGRHD